MNLHNGNEVKRSGVLSAVGHTLEHNCTDVGSAVFQVFSHTAVVGCQLVAEGRTSDDAPWVTLHLMPTNDTTPSTPLVVTAAFTGIPAFGWRADLQGLTTYRLRVSALTSGSLVVQSRLAQQEYS